jgi:hypothetical protein
MLSLRRPGERLIVGLLLVFPLASSPAWAQWIGKQTRGRQLISGMAAQESEQSGDEMKSALDRGQCLIKVGEDVVDIFDAN